MSSLVDGFKIGLKRARKGVGIKYSQWELAEKFEVFLRDQHGINKSVSESTIRNWEQIGRPLPSVETIDLLCEFFKCDPEYLFNRIECRTNDIQFIHDFTGLDEDVIKTLNKYNKYDKGVTVFINHLISSGSILKSLVSYYTSKFWDNRFMPLFSLFNHRPRCEDELIGNVINRIPRDSEHLFDKMAKNKEAMSREHKLLGLAFIATEIPDIDTKLMQHLVDKVGKRGEAVDDFDKLAAEYIQYSGMFGQLSGLLEDYGADPSKLLEPLSYDPWKPQNNYIVESVIDLSDVEPVEDDGLPF